MVGLIDQGSSGFTAHLIPSGLSVITAHAEPHQLILNTLNPETGTSTASKPIELNISGSFYSVPQVIGWVNDTGYFVIETHLYVINVSSGTVIYSW